MVGAGNLRLPHTWCHTLVPRPECPRESRGHWVCSWFHFLRREPSLCALKLRCPANQGTANGDDWKNCFQSLVWAKAPMLLDARTPITVSATPLNFSCRRLGFASHSCPVLSLGRSYFRQQYTKLLRLVLNEHTTMQWAVFWYDCNSRVLLEQMCGQERTGQYCCIYLQHVREVQKCVLLCESVWLNDREVDYNFYQYLGEDLIILSWGQ